MLLMIENGIRGIAAISHRHAKANNEYMGTEFDSAEKSKFISYLDVNNLYGWAMSKQLPTTDGRTDGRMDWWTDGRRTDNHTDKETDKHTYIQN